MYTYIIIPHERLVYEKVHMYIVFWETCNNNIIQFATKYYNVT